jgi:hypothetical protein
LARRQGNVERRGYWLREFPEAGGVMSYGSSVEGPEAVRRLMVLGLTATVKSGEGLERANQLRRRFDGDAADCAGIVRIWREETSEGWTAGRFSYQTRPQFGSRPRPTVAA